MPASKAKMKAIAKYEQKAYDKILLRLPKGTADKIKEAAGEGGSVNGYVREAVEAKLNGTAPTPTSEKPREATQKATGMILTGGVVCLPLEKEKCTQNTTEAETGRTACTLDSKIYNYAVNGAKVLKISVPAYLDKAVDALNLDTANLARIKAQGPTPEQNADFKLQMQHEQTQRRREVMPGDWRENSDSTIPAEPERGEAHFLASLANIQRKAEEAKQKAAEAVTNAKETENT